MAEFSVLLLGMFMFSALVIGIIIGRMLMALQAKSYIAKWKAEAEKGIREDAVNRSRVTLGGKMAEQLAPYFPDFPYDPTEARFIGSPVDFIVFQGSARNEPEEVVFVEVKSGNGRLSRKQNRLKEVIEKKRVRWEELRVE